MHAELAGHFLKTLLAASWWGGLVVLLILAIRPLLGARVPARWRCLLWGLALARLVVPAFVLPSSPASLQNLRLVERPGERAAQAIDAVYTEYFAPASAETQPSLPALSAAPKPLPSVRARLQWRSIPWPQAGALLWALGAVSFGAWMCGGAWQLTRKMRGEQGTLSATAAAAWTSSLARFSQRRAPRLQVVSWIESPALVGVFRPVILIPQNGTESFSREDWEHIFLHELAHYRRLDPWVHALELIALCVHWFNPIVWLGFRCFRADRELAADEQVLSRLAGDSDRPAAYGRTLLKILAGHSASGFSPALIGIVDDCAQLKQRLRRIVAYRPAGPLGSAVGLAAILLVAAVVLGREADHADMSPYAHLPPADALVLAAEKNDLPALRQLLEKGANIDGIASGPGEKTALAAAAAANQLDAVRLLVTWGASINAPTNGSSPAYLAAVRNGSLSSAAYLRSEGAVADAASLEAAKQEEAQRKVRVFQASVPAPRGRILDRKGHALAVNRSICNLALRFPKLQLTEEEALAFAREQAVLASRVLARPVDFSTAAVVRHARQWAALPLDLVSDLVPEQQAAIAKLGSESLVLHYVDQRHYPNGVVAAHLLGFVGQNLNMRGAPLPTDELPSPASVGGRDALELAFNDVLSGTVGRVGYTFDQEGRRISEAVTEDPVPGRDLVTTLDLDVQRLCENALGASAKRGAMVIMDPATGDVLAMASLPSYDPNLFVPTISVERWRTLMDDPGVPLLSRAYRGAYPPGSVFKPFVGLAALQSGAMRPDERLPNPPSLKFGMETFHDWKNVDRGMLTCSEALEQNADTWFYQAGVKTGAKSILEMAQKFGLGKPATSLPGDLAGVLPTDEYLQKVYHKDWSEVSDEWRANLAIGQGATKVTPIQMAQAMAALANGGEFERAHLAIRTQTAEGKVLGEYQRERPMPIGLRPEVVAEIRNAMVAAVNGEKGAGRAARVEGIPVAGVTGAASWMTGKSGKRTLSWFVGFAPADQAKYAFAVTTESDAETESAAANAASIAGNLLRALFGVSRGDEPQ